MQSAQNPSLPVTLIRKFWPSGSSRIELTKSVGSLGVLYLYQHPSRDPKQQQIILTVGNKWYGPNFTNLLFASCLIFGVKSVTLAILAGFVISLKDWATFCSLLQPCSQVHMLCSPDLHTNRWNAGWLQHIPISLSFSTHTAESALANYQEV